MSLLDWRDVDAALLTPVWAEQTARWSQRLFWDAHHNWAQVEAERLAGRLPGMVLLEGRDVAAWAFFLVHQGTLQIGGFESNSSAATRTLLDAVLHAVDPELAPSGAVLFAFSSAPGLVPALVARGFGTERYEYLVRETSVVRPVRAGLPWDMQAAVELPSLLARSYGPPEVTRPFVRHGTIDEWREYSAQLLGSIGCGAFEPNLSASSIDHDGRLHGAIVTTLIGPGTAHIAQVAVDPAQRGSGLAGRMLDAVVERVRAEGLDRVTLLVSERNTAARHLYNRRGFHDAATFIAAGRAATHVELRAQRPELSSLHA
jgi:ribosomal protein S18 acetylase RimI-like enzyme